VNLSTSKSLGMTKPECLHQGFHSSCHHSTSFLGSTRHRFTPRSTSYTIYPPQVSISRGAQVASHSKTCPRLVVYSNLVDTTLTLHTPKSHTQYYSHSPGNTSFHHARSSRSISISNKIYSSKRVSSLIAGYVGVRLRQGKGLQVSILPCKSYHNMTVAVK
jgi:hypothetical protein